MICPRIDRACLLVLWWVLCAGETLVGAQVLEAQERHRWEVSAGLAPEFSVIFPLVSEPYRDHPRIYQKSTTLGSIFIDFGIPVEASYRFDWGKLSVSYVPSLMAEGLGLGYRQEWFLGDFFSLEAGAQLKGMLYWYLLARQRSLSADFFYAGVEATGRANLILFGSLVLYMSTGLHARVLLQSSVLVGGPVGLGVAFRF